MTEALTLLKLVAEFLIVSAAARKGSRWIELTIAVNLVLVSVFGAKIITIFGFDTNAGNVFYAGVFLGIQMLVERYGPREGFRAVQFGVATLLMFILLGQMSVLQPGSSLNAVNAATEVLFSAAPRIALASVLAFVAAQYVNITIYRRLHERTGQRLLWLRAGAATVAGQFVDSAIFFVIAFSGIADPRRVIGIMVVGFVLKCIIGLLGSLCLYANRQKLAELS